MFRKDQVFWMVMVFGKHTIIMNVERLLNYLPKVPLEAGLRLTIDKDPLLQL